MDMLDHGPELMSDRRTEGTDRHTPKGHRPEHVLVGVDGSPSSRRALLWALDHARPGDTITLVHVWQPSAVMVDAGFAQADDDRGPRSLVARELARARQHEAAASIVIRGDVVRGEPRHVLAQLDADTIVVGADDSGLSRIFLGPVAAHLARRPGCVIVVVPRSR